MRVLKVAGAAALLCALSVPASAGVVYQLSATNISTDPGPLFSSSDVSGYLQLSDSVTAGTSFGPSQIEKFVFDFAGFSVTSADITDIDALGTISADGNLISFLESGFDVRTDYPGCSFFCDGLLAVNDNRQSNFIAVDDFPDDNTLSLLTFDAVFTRAATGVPEPMSIAVFGMGMLGAVALRRRKARQA